jgi:shikimate dehydrogenase
MPLKVDVVPLLGERSPEVRLVGAANTIVRLGDDKRLVGHNTDLVGVREPLQEWMESERFFTASLIGTGGAAAAAMMALMRRPASLHVNNYGRTYNRALAFRRRFADDPDAFSASAGIEELAQARVTGRDPELLINASALGMRGHPPLLVDLAALAPGSIVFDMVYDPLETELLRNARAHGLQTVDGLRMLVAQAAAAFGLLFCEEAPREHDEELRTLLTS